MKAWIPFVVAAILIGFVVWKQTEKFQPEFLDKRQVIKTVKAEKSSYEQMTNHMDPAPYSMGPIQGVQTPFQVNQYRAYVV